MKKSSLSAVILAVVLILAQCIPRPRPELPKALLIDDTHENAYLVSSEAPTTFEKLIKVFEEEGFSVSLSSVVGFKPEDYSVVLIAVPTKAFSSEENDGLLSLLGLGGKVIILGEFFPYYDNSVLNRLLRRQAQRFSSSTIRSSMETTITPPLNIG